MPTAKSLDVASEPVPTVLELFAGAEVDPPLYVVPRKTIIDNIKFFIIIRYLPNKWGPQIQKTIKFTINIILQRCSNCLCNRNLRLTRRISRVYNILRCS